MPDIFISYSHEDREKAQRIADLLCNLGFTVWWDRDIPVGKQFDQEIEKQLSQSTCVLVLWSQSSTRSNWVRAEADLALKNSKLLPILIDNTELPLQHRLIQALDFINWSRDSSSQAFQALVKEINGLLNISHSNFLKTCMRRLCGGSWVANLLSEQARSMTSISALAALELSFHEYARVGDVKSIGIIENNIKYFSTSFSRRAAELLRALCYLAFGNIKMARGIVENAPDSVDFTSRERAAIALHEIMVFGALDDAMHLDSAWDSINDNSFLGQGNDYPFVEHSKPFDKALLSVIYGQERVIDIVKNLPVGDYRGLAHFSAATSKSIRKSPYILQAIEQRGNQSGWKATKSVLFMRRRCREYERLLLPVAGTLFGPRVETL